MGKLFASDIHDGALQDLKLVMDKIELEDHLDVDSILDKLAALGQEIRDKLHNIRRLAEKNDECVDAKRLVARHCL